MKRQFIYLAILTLAAEATSQTTFETSRDIHDRRLTDSSTILFETFSNVQPLGPRPSTYVSQEQIPDKGPTGYLRQWEPGLKDAQATDYSRLDFGSEGYLTSNYSGGDGERSQDELVYPIGNLMSPLKGTIELKYRPHYGDDDGSAIMYIITTKGNISNPKRVRTEFIDTGTCDITLCYSGWSGRKYFSFGINELLGYGDGWYYQWKPTYVQTHSPDEFSGGTEFVKDVWMIIRLVWDASGIAGLYGATSAIFISNRLMATTSNKYSTQSSFGNWIVFGAQGSGLFGAQGYMKNYSGMSGDLDDIWVSSEAILPAVTSAKEIHVHPNAFVLGQNYPNPFNPSTVISFQLPVVSNVRLQIYDLLGREVAVLVNEEKMPGTYTVTWNASGLPSGIYFCRLMAGGMSQMRKAVLLR